MRALGRAVALSETATIHDACIGIFQRAGQDGIPACVAAERIAAETAGG